MAKGLFRCLQECFNGPFLVVELNIAVTCQSAEKLNDFEDLALDDYIISSLYTQMNLCKQKKSASSDVSLVSFCAN